MATSFIRFIPEDPDFTPTLEQYQETIKYFLKNDYIKNLDGSIPELMHFTPREGIDKIFFEGITVGVTSPSKVRSGPEYRKYMEDPIYYDFNERKILEIEGSPSKIYDTGDVLKLVGELIRNNRIIKQISFRFPTTPKLKYLFLYNKKNLYIQPESVQEWCNEIEISISPMLGLYKVMEKREEFFTDETYVNHNFDIMVTIGDVFQLNEMALFLDTIDDADNKNKEIHPDNEKNRRIFFEDYCMELNNNPEIKKILRDIDSIMNTKMILGAKAGGFY